MKKRNAFLLIVLFLALLLVVLFGSAVCTLYKIETHPPQIETIYQAADGEAPEKIVYEISETFRRDYHHLNLDIEALDSGAMGCSVVCCFANGEKISSSFMESSSFHRFTIPSDHIKTIQWIEISELENISCITMWNTYINP